MRKSNLVLHLIILIGISFIIVAVQMTERKAILALQEEIEQFHSVLVIEENRITKNIATMTKKSDPLRQKSNKKCPIIPGYRNNSEEESLVAMASFPGTGNTWLRYSLEQYTGILTGSLYNDSVLREELRGEGISDGRVSAIKMHGFSHSKEKLFEFDPVLNCSFKKAIILMRHPKEAIIAETNRRFTEPEHTGVIRRGRWKSKIVQDYIISLLDKWSRFMLHWFVTFTGHKHIVLYENLKNDLLNEIRKVANFLELPPIPEGVECLKWNRDGKFKRKPMAWQVYLSPEVEEALRIAFVRTKNILAENKIQYTFDN